ncbi:MAG: response regulator [Planctomycetota bacterium]
MQDGKHVILSVDDDPDTRLFLKTVLEDAGFVSVEAASAEEALRLYKQTDPDALIVDLMMEEVDAGAQFVKELRLLDNRAPVYMLSSVGDGLNLEADYRELGLAGVFQKPISPERLVAVLEARLGD